MVPSGSSNSIGGAQSVNSSLLRSNSGLLGGSQPGSVPSQPPFSSLVSPRSQFNSNSLLGNISNAPPLSNSFGNGGPVGGLSSPPSNLQQHGGFGAVDTVISAGTNPLSFTASATQSQGQQQCFQNPSSSQVLADQPQFQIDAVLNFQQQFSLPPSQQQQQQLLRGGLSNVNHMAPVKLEPQMGSIKLEPQMGPNNHIGPSQQLQTFRGINTVKMEPQQLQTLRSFGPVKMENQHSDPSMFLQQQQQQHIFQLSRQNSHAAAAQLSFLQQQRILQLQQQQQQQQHQQQQQQQQQQQIAKTLPQQRSQLHQQLLQQNLPIRTTMKSTMYEPGMCARRLTQYMYHQQHRPQDNNIEFWRKFIAEYFAPDAKKRWCVSLYGTGRQTTGVLPQDVWHCEICTHKPGRGFETTVEVLPRLFQIKYASGTLEELLYVDMPREYQNALGQIVLDYSKAIQESVFEQLRVVRDGHLRIVFNPDLKISSWEFCARRHEELVPRRVIIPQVGQLGAVVQRYQAATQNAPSGLPIQDLQNTCNSFVASARQLAKALEVPLVNDLGYTKRYVRCLQISEVVNSMKDLIDHSKETGAGPMESLMNFPGRQQQIMNQNANHNDPSSMHATGLQISAASNDVGTNNSLNAASSLSASAATIVGTPQNSMNTEQEKQMNSLNSPYAGSNVQIPSASSSNSVPPLKPSCSNNPVSISQNANATHLSTTASLAMLQENDANDSQSSVQQILQELMMSSQLNDTDPMGTDTKPVNGMHPTLSAMAPSMNTGNCLARNGVPNSSVTSGAGFTGLYGTGTSASVSGMRAAMTNNGMVMNGRHGTIPLPHDLTAINRQSQDLNNQLLDRLEAVNKFDNLQFDWNSSP